MEPPSADAATGPTETVQAGANANPCHTHSKNFEDCLNSHEIRLGKCQDHLRLLYQCRRKKPLVVMEAAAAAATPMGNPADSPHIFYESAMAAATAMRNPDSCHIPYEKLKDCINNDEVRLGKCELHLHGLFVCHMRARSSESTPAPSAAAVKRPRFFSTDVVFNLILAVT